LTHYWQLSSSIHAYDIKLCHFQDAVQDFSSKHLRSSDVPTPLEVHPSSACFEKCFHAESVSDQQIWDIVARWQGLRPLQHLYLNPAIHSEYTASLCVAGDDNPQETEVLNILGLARDGKETRHTNSELSTTRKFSTAETGRFYRALTGYWLASKSRKLAEQCRYALQSTQNKIYRMVDSMWEQRTDLQESLDILEIFDFVYVFLCQHIDGVDVGSFTDWVDNDWHNDWRARESSSGMRSFFIMNIWLTLDPPDVIELLSFTSLWREQVGTRAETWSQETRRDYLRLRGFYTNPTYNVEFRDVGESPDLWYSTSMLEDACALQLQKLTANGLTKAAAAWEKYRTTLWQKEARGRFGQMQSATLLEFIKPGTI
jgi:hypothetical protein